MKTVRVRFAPSPTGFVHLGSLRTALYNYLFARKNNGTLILRIEDTDQNRYVEGAVDNLLSTLDWAGISFDEGPVTGGNYGPYFQSERNPVYREKIGHLLENGQAYPCFCSAERLDKMRNEQQQAGQDVRYDGLCRRIPAAEARQRMLSETHVIRLKVPETGQTVVHDLVRGAVSFQNNLTDDQILIKSDGYPTYHFANVVDDHLMQISHVIRGEEWLPSTPKHILLYQAFGWEVPQFAHLPLLLNPDKTKLSKRQGDVAVEDYKNKGYLPQALVNFVALLGWHSDDDREIFTKDELIEAFSLERVTKAGAVFDVQKLNWMNGQYIRNLPEEDYLEQGGAELRRLNRSGEAETNRLILLAIRNQLEKFSDLSEKTDLFFSEKIGKYAPEAEEWLRKQESKQIFRVMLTGLEKYPKLDIDVFRDLMKDVQKETGIKGKDLWMPVRAAITGLTEGPELPAVLAVLGMQKVKSFLKQAVEL